jgi:hypothetical protein
MILNLICTIRFENLYISICRLYMVQAFAGMFRVSGYLPYGDGYAVLVFCFFCRLIRLLALLY